MEYVVLYYDWPLEVQVGPHVLVGKANKLISNSLASLLLYGSLSIRKLGRLCIGSHKLKVWDSTHSLVYCTL